MSLVPKLESQETFFEKMCFFFYWSSTLKESLLGYKNELLGMLWSVFETQKHISSIFWAQNWKKLKFSPSLLIFMLYTAILASQAFVKCCLAGWKWHVVTLGGCQKIEASNNFKKIFENTLGHASQHTRAPKALDKPPCL